MAEHQLLRASEIAKNLFLKGKTDWPSRSMKTSPDLVYANR